jgi:O-methyltransferase domain/Dimerisation domain
VDAADELLRMVNAYRVSQAIHVAAELRLSDHLAGGPLAAAELAAAAGCHEESLYRLMRALSAAGVYEELPDGRFTTTVVGDELRTGIERDLGSWARFIGRSNVWQAWGALEHSVRTGENAFLAVHGVSVWAYRSGRPEEGEIFDAAMTAMSRHIADAVLAAYNFEGLIVDVGGGHGAMLAAILRRFPGTRGVLFDQPHVVTGADLAEVADRCDVVAGNMFASVPAGGDVYVLKAILHDWPDDRAVAILRACRSAMKRGARAVILERLLTGPPHTVAGLASAMSDLNMMIGPGGRERTADEYERLLTAAGLRLDRVIPTASDVSVLTATSR